MRRFGYLLFGLIACFSNSLFANIANRPDVTQFIQQMSQQHGFKRQQLVRLFQNVNVQPAIIHAINTPYEEKSWDAYKAIFLTDARLKAGIDFWRSHRQSLAKAEARYGVPPQVIIAILGVETFYGQKQGTYRVIDALSTLAFEYPKRSPFFTKELAEYLLLCREQGISPLLYRGSYAGAIGTPQFMPSSYRYYGKRLSGQGPIDLVHDDDAIIASVANYFHRHGWQHVDRVAVPAVVSAQAAARVKTYYRKAVYTPKQLAMAGVRPQAPTPAGTQRMGLIALKTAHGPQYWATYPNFYVITRYNTSPQYAMAVYLLSERIKKQWIAQH